MMKCFQLQFILMVILLSTLTTQWFVPCEAAHFEISAQAQNPFTQEINQTLSEGEYFFFDINMTKDEVFVCVLKIEPMPFVRAYAFDEVQYQGFLENGTLNSVLILNTQFTEDYNFTIQTFQASHSDEWHILFVNELFFEIQIVGYAAVDRTPPTVQTVQFDRDMPLSGVSTIIIGVTDDFLPIPGVEMYVDGELVQLHTVLHDYYQPWTVVTFRFESYNWENGNHTISFRAYDARGRIGEFLQVHVTTMNNFWTIPSNGHYILMAYIGIVMIFLLAKPTIIISSQLLRRFRFSSKHSLAILTVGIIALTIGFVVEYLAVSSARGVAQMIGFSIIGLAGIHYSIYLLQQKKTHISITIPIIDEKKNEHADLVKSDTPILEIQNIPARSDALDKVRGNMRNGMSIVMGIGTLILFWTLDSYSILELPVSLFLVLIGSICLVGLNIAGIITSFLHRPIVVNNIPISEGLVPKTTSKVIFRKQLECEIEQKENILTQMRRAIALGFVLFVSFVSLGLILPVYFEATRALEHIPIFISAIPLTLIVGACTSIALVFLQPVLLPEYVKTCDEIKPNNA